MTEPKARESALAGLNSLPLIWRGVLLVGAPTIFALVLLGKDVAIQLGFAEDVPSKQYQTLINSHVALHNAVTVNTTLLHEAKFISQTNNNILLAICVNQANSIDEREERCINAQRR